MKLLDTTKLVEDIKRRAPHLQDYENQLAAITAGSLHNISVILSQKSIVDDKATLREVLKRIEEKNSWGEART